MTDNNENEPKRVVVIVGSISGSFSRLAALIPILIAEQGGEGVDIIMSPSDDLMKMPECPIRECPADRITKADKAKTHPVRPTKFQNHHPHKSRGIKTWKRFRR